MSNRARPLKGEELSYREWKWMHGSCVCTAERGMKEGWYKENTITAIGEELEEGVEVLCENVGLSGYHKITEGMWREEPNCLSTGVETRS